MPAPTPPVEEMNHESIQESQIPDRYVMEKLSAEERLRFEEHFIDCPICLEHLESLEGLRAGLKELSSRGTPSAEPGRSALVRFLREPLTARLLAAACLAAAVLLPALFLAELRRTRGQLENARREIGDARRESAALGRTLEVERKTGSSVASSAAPLAASVFTLNLTRGAGADGPDNRIVLREPREWVILLIDRPGAPRFASYRARISTVDRRPIGQALTASPAPYGMLAVSLPPALLAAGDYVLTLDGLGTRPAPDLATYPFRAVLRK